MLKIGAKDGIRMESLPNAEFLPTNFCAGTLRGANRREGTSLSAFLSLLLHLGLFTAARNTFSQSMLKCTQVNDSKSRIES